MTRLHEITLLLTLSLVATVGHAADPEFKVGVVTASRAYEREVGSVAIGGFQTASASEWVSRVTVALDGVLITGEWEPKTTISATAEDFPRGSDVPAAAARNKLLLKHPDGSVVEAKIVKRERAPEDEKEDRG
jgi:hypothetical protein